MTTKAVAAIEPPKYSCTAHLSPLIGIGNFKIAVGVAVVNFTAETLGKSRINTIDGVRSGNSGSSLPQVIAPPNDCLTH